jgi:DNA-binding CsgD family transcriptional regulator
MYDRKKIEKLFCQYARGGRKKDLSQLIIECGKLVAKVVTRYPDYQTYSDDICQEVMLRLWKNFRQRSVIKKWAKNPYIYIVLKMRSHLHNVLNRCAREYGISMAISETECEILDMREDGLEYEEIGRRLGLRANSVRSYCSVAKSKDDFVIVDNNEQILSEQIIETDDPAYQYEQKEQFEIQEERAKNCAHRHPNLRSKSAQKIFEKHVEKILRGGIDE